jgi:hypothetical protein
VVALRFFGNSLIPYSVSLRGSNAHCMDATISKEDEEPWRVTFVYGELKPDLRHEFWDLLRRLRRE